MNLEEIKARAEEAILEYKGGYGCRASEFCARIVPALIAEVEQLQHESLSYHAIGVEHYEETVRLKAQLEAEILRRDSLDETLKNARAEVKQLQKLLYDSLKQSYENALSEYDKQDTKLAAIHKAAEPITKLVKTCEDYPESWPDIKLSLGVIRALAEAIKIPEN